MHQITNFYILVYFLIIGCCRDSAEVEEVLNQWEGCDFAGQVRFPRLMLAMDYSQKEFVAHPNTQGVSFDM